MARKTFRKVITTPEKIEMIESSNKKLVERFLKYISIFTLADIRNVILNVSINPILVVLAICITIVFMILTMICYEKKELV